MARKASPAQIKSHRVYSTWEVAEALGVHRQTVIRWVKDKGLKADTSKKPWLFQGSVLKVFLGKRQSKSHCKLALHHCYCFGCHAPREPDGKIADYVQQTPSTGMLTALCPACGSVMNKVIRRAALEAIRAKIDVTIQKADARLVSPADPPSNVTFKKDDDSHDKAQRG